MDDLAEVGKQLRIPLDRDKLEALDLYVRRLMDARERAGLTSLRDRRAIVQRHFGESLALLRALEDAGVPASPAIDIGAGAGFPGLPIKIARPELELTLLEATGKKAAFLAEVVQELGLSGVTVVQARAEEFAREPRVRGAYALALARAVAPLRVLLELALPFLRAGGFLAAPKGSGARREVTEASRALEVLGGEVERIEPLNAPDGGFRPTLVLVRKVAETPEQYPRRAGMPGKRPLG